MGLLGNLLCFWRISNFLLPNSCQHERAIYFLPFFSRLTCGAITLDCQEISYCMWDVSTSASNAPLYTAFFVVLKSSTHCKARCFIVLAKFRDFTRVLVPGNHDLRLLHLFSTRAMDLTLQLILPSWSHRQVLNVIGHWHARCRPQSIGPKM